MFGISISELLVIVIIAFLFIGPEKLPEIMKTFGKNVKQIKNMSNDFKNSVYDEINKDETIVVLQNELKKAKEELTPFKDEINKDLNINI